MKSPMTFAARRRRSSVLYISDALVNPHAGARCRRGSTIGGAGCALRTLPEGAAAATPSPSAAAVGAVNGAAGGRQRRRSSVVATGVISAHGVGISGGVANGAFSHGNDVSGAPSALMEEEEEEIAATGVENS